MPRVAVVKAALSLTTGLALLATAQPAWAQATASPDPKAPPAAPSEQTQPQGSTSVADTTPAAGAFGDIVVTAQRREQRLSQVPLSIVATTGEALAAAGVTDSRALEQVTPSLNFTTGFTKSATSFSIRGSQSYSAESGLQPSVGVIIDNMPLARQAEVVLDLADIDRVEVLAGPQGTLFGKNATAGVINIVSNRPTQDYTFRGETSLTTDQEAIAKATLNIPAGERVAFRINGYYHYLSPLLPNAAGMNLYGQRSYGIQGKALFNFTDTTNLLLTANYNHFWDSMGVEMVLVPSKGALGVLERQVFGPGTIGRGSRQVNQDSDPSERGRSESYIAEINSQLSDSLKLVSITGYRKYLLINTSVDSDAGPTGVNFGRGFSPNPLNYPVEAISRPDGAVSDFHYWSEEARLAYSANGLDIIGGTFYQNYYEKRYQQYAGFVVDGSLLGRTAGVRYITDNSVNATLSDDTWALFADATVKIVPMLNVFAGVRYTSERIDIDYARAVFLNPVPGFFNPVTLVNTAAPVSTLAFNDQRRRDTNWSGRAGIQFQPTPALNYYASYNRGYKGAAANIGSGVASAAAALLNPEIGDSFEIGAKQRFFNGRFALDAAIYKQKIRNIQQTATLPGSVVRSLLNAGDLKTDGFEVTATAYPVQGLSLAAGVVYNNARYSGPFGFPCGPSATAGVGSCRADGTIALDGTRAVGVPKWKATSSINYDKDVTSDAKIIARVAYTWRSSIQYTLQHEPLTEEPDSGILDASIGVGGSNGNWEVSVFGKNLTDHFYYAYLNTANGFVGQSYGFLPRDFTRYGGVRLTMNF